MNKPPKWSQAEIECLRLLYKSKMTTAQIAAQIGRSEHAVAVKAHKLGFAKNLSYRKDLTDQQKRWLALNFPHVATDICALMLGLSRRTCIRRAREMGLQKTPQFMKEAQAHTAQKAKESHLRNGTYNPKGVVPANFAKGAAYRFKPRQ